MIVNSKALKKFELDRLRKKVNVAENMRLFNEMYLEALSLGVLPLKNRLEGIEHKIKFARALNAKVSKPL